MPAHFLHQAGPLTAAGLSQYEPGMRLAAPGQRPGTVPDAVQQVANMCLGLPQRPRTARSLNLTAWKVLAMLCNCSEPAPGSNTCSTLTVRVSHLFGDLLRLPWAVRNTLGSRNVVAKLCESVWQTQRAQRVIGVRQYLLWLPIKGAQLWPTVVEVAR